MKLNIENYKRDFNMKSGYILYEREHRFQPYVIHRFTPWDDSVHEGHYFCTLEEASEAFHKMTEPDDVLRKELEETKKKLEAAEELLTTIATNGFMPDKDEREIYRTDPGQRNEDELGEIVDACRRHLGWEEYQEEE